MKITEWYQRCRSGDFIVKLVKNSPTFLLFYISISKYWMGGYFFKTSEQGTVLKFHGFKHRVT